MHKIFLGMLGIAMVLTCTACGSQISTGSSTPLAENTPSIPPDLIPATETAVLDSDNDGIPDMQDLCPAESAPEGLAGCLPLKKIAVTQAMLNTYTEIYDLPADPSGRISVAGDRILLLTNYQAGQLSLYDLADGTLLRKLSIPDLQNDTPTLLPQEILLQNYDQQRWRLVDINGNVLFSADEELEMIIPSQNLLVSRAEGEIIFRELDHPQTILAQTPGYYVTRLPKEEAFLIITPGSSCVLSTYDPRATGGTSVILGQDNPLCSQPPRFTADGQYLISNTATETNLYSLQDFQLSMQYAGIPMAVLSDALLLLQDDALIYQPLDGSAPHTIYNLREELLKGMTVNPLETWAAIRIGSLQQPVQFSIKIIDLQNGRTIAVLQTDTLQFMNDIVLAWQFSGKQIQFLNGQTLQEIASLQAPAVQGLQIVLNGDYLLVTSSDLKLHVYRIQE